MTLNKIKAAKIVGEGKVSLSQYEIPKLGSGDVLVKMMACGICGSDLEKIFGSYGMVSGRLGHEPSGIIKKVGDSVKDFVPGDRVFVHHHVPCYSCHFCRHQDFTMCDRYQKSNLDPCGLSEEFVVPDWNVSRGGILKIPDSMTFEEASMIEPLACCLRGLNKIKLQRGDNVAIIGAGPAGLMFVSLLKLFGVGELFIIDVNDFRLSFSKKINNEICIINALKENYIDVIQTETGSVGVDVSIVATSNMEGFKSSFEITRKGGNVLLFGVPPKGSFFSTDISKIYSNEQSIITSYAASEIETNQALKIIAHRRLDLNSLVTHRFDLANTQKAIDCAHRGIDSMKVIITNI